jgi:ankyrin repeat protein
MSPLYIVLVLTFFRSTFESDFTDAIYRRDFEAMKIMVRDPAYIEDCRRELFSALFGVNTDELQFLVDAGIDVDLTKDNGLTALLLAASNYDAKIVRILLLGKANVSDYFDRGSSVLLWAVRADHFDLVSLLVQAGADVNYVDEAGKFALGEAVAGGNLNMINLLVGHGADTSRVPRVRVLSGLNFTMFSKFAECLPDGNSNIVSVVNDTISISLH